MSTVPVVPMEEKVAVLDEKAAKAGVGSAGEYAMKFACASMSCMFASTVSNPFDIIKVRQQLRTQIPGAAHNAFWAVGLEMVRKEGARSLMNGWSPSMLRELIYSGFRLGTYEFFKDHLHSLSQGALTREGVGLKILAACCSSSIGSAIANPTDLVKVRMQAHYPDGSPYHSMRHAFATVFQDGMHHPSWTGHPLLGGLRAVWRGVEATTVRGVVLSISQICSYDHVKQTLKSHGIMKEGVSLHLTASIFAGLFCSITSSPVDVVKVRLMNDKHRQFSGVLHCVKNVLAHEGPLAFYKGFGMCWARLGTHTIVSFLVFERLRRLFGIDPL